MLNNKAVMERALSTNNSSPLITSSAGENDDVKNGASNPKTGGEVDESGDTKMQEDEKSAVPKPSKTPFEQVNDVMSILKTAHPFLALSMETMVDQILARLKPIPEEDIYRVLYALLSSAIQENVNLMSNGNLNIDAVKQTQINTVERFIGSNYVANTKVNIYCSHF